MPRYKDDGYPRNVRYECGQWYYRKGKQKRVPLGRTEAEMWANYAKMFGVDGRQVKTLSAALDMYIKEELPEKSVQHQTRLHRIIRDVRPAFGQMVPSDITVGMLQEYLNLIKRKRGLATAHQHQSFLKYFFTCMQRWDFLPLTNNNVARLTTLPSLEARRYAPPDSDFWAFFRFASMQLKVAMLIARGTGMRESDVICKQITDVDDAGIVNVQQKRKRGAREVRQRFQHNAYTLLAIQLARNLLRDYDTTYLIPNWNCKPFIGKQFSNKWRYEMQRAVDKGVLKERFTFHDIRRMAGSEQPDVQSAAKLLGNTAAIANKHYRVGFDVVANTAAPKEIPEELWREYVPN